MEDGYVLILNQYEQLPTKLKKRYATRPNAGSARLCVLSYGRGKFSVLKLIKEIIAIGVLNLVEQATFTAQRCPDELVEMLRKARKGL